MQLQNLPLTMDSHEIIYSVISITLLVLLLISAIVIVFFIAGRQRLKQQLEIDFKEQEKTIITKEKQRYENLLLNILPYEVAQELKETGKSEPRTFDAVTVMFTDFKDFTLI